MPKSKKWRPPWAWFLAALGKMATAAKAAGVAAKGAAVGAGKAVGGAAAKVGGGLKGLAPAAKKAGVAAGKQTPLYQSPAGQLMQHAFKAMQKAPAKGADLMVGKGTTLPAELSTSVSRMAAATKPASMSQVPWTAAGEKAAARTANPMPSTGESQRAPGLAAGKSTDPIDMVYDMYKGFKEKMPFGKGRLMGGSGAGPTYYDRLEGESAEDIAGQVPILGAGVPDPFGGAPTEMPRGPVQPPPDKPWWWYYRGAS